MSDLARTQHLFSEALFQPDKPMDKEIRSQFAVDNHLSRRFSVYRNNVHHSLIEALADSYPVIKKLVGAQAFQAVAQAYLLNNPPSSAVLLDFAEGFAQFLVQFEPLKQLGYLADVARLEYLWLNTYHAATFPALSPESLQTVSESTLNDLVLQLHPSVHILMSSYAVGTIWQLHQDDTELQEQLDVSVPESIAFVRTGRALDLAVQLCILDKPYINFLKSIKAGYTLGESMAMSMQSYPEWNPSEALAFFLNHDFFCALLNTEHV